MRKIVHVVLLILPALFFAQRRNRYKWEWVGGTGPNNFLGAIGGSPNIGQHGFTGFQDWNWYSTRPTFSAGLRYKNTRHFAFKSSLDLAWLYGSDTYSDNFYRHNRNISFLTTLVELSAQAEYYPFKEAQGSLYRVKNSRGKKKLNLNPYVFAGVGALYFDPRAQWNSGVGATGQWYNLKSLHTEGQGLPGGPAEYSSFAVSLPFGAGMKYSLDKQWSIGFELGLHYTNSDWLDDTHGVYYNNAAIVAAYGAAAGHFADPSLSAAAAGGPPTGTEGITGVGQKRGFDSHFNDAYVFGLFNVNYKVMYRKRTRSKF